MIFYQAVDPATLHTTIIGTQADARAINADFTQIDIPTDKAGLMAWANDRQNEIDVLRDQLATEPDSEYVPTQATDESEERPFSSVEISEAILDLEGDDFDRVLKTTVSRLGTLRAQGYAGLEALRKRDPWFTDNVTARTSVERGLGYLLLEAG